MESLNIKFNLVSPRIIFGNGRISELGQEILNVMKAKGNNQPKALLVSGKSFLKESGYLNKIRNNLEDFKITLEIYDKAGKEPTTAIFRCRSKRVFA